MGIPVRIIYRTGLPFVGINGITATRDKEFKRDSLILWNRNHNVPVRGPGRQSPLERHGGVEVGEV